MSSQQSSSESSTSKEKKPKRKIIPVMEPVRKVKTNAKQIIINLSMTRYEVITDVAQQLQWRVQYGSKKGDWDVLWTDQMIEPETLIKMHFFQKISHFPGIHVLARKNLLGLSFMEMQKKFPQAYNFFPKTYLLPADYPVLRQQIEKKQKKCYIVKPEADCQGKGIFLTFKTDDVENGKHYVVQQYLQNPFLVQGLKFDFRVYVLLAGTNPMRLFVYQQGLARFATQKYHPPNKSNLKKVCMHLTNYAINKKNPKYVYNHSVKNMATGHKRSLTSVLSQMKRRGLNPNIFKEKLDDVLIKTIILGQPLVSHQYKFCQPDDQYRQMCFHILGVDVMIDQFLNPIVIQVNHTPSFATDTPLDYFIKYNLIKDTLLLMNVNEQNKKQLIEKTNKYQRQRVTNAKRLIETQQQKQRINQCLRKRDEHQRQNMGKYRKIYPIDNEQRMDQYQQYLKYAEKVYFSENNFIRSQIQSQKQKQKQKQKNPSKKSLIKKKSTIQSPKPMPRNHHSLSQKQHHEAKTKNSSVQFFKKQICNSSLLSKGGFTSCLPKSSSKIGNFGDNYIKITKSISQVTNNDESKPHHRINTIRNLPKIQSTSPVKNSVLENSKIKYIGLRKKKLGESKTDKKRQSDSKAEKMDSGTFLTPKVMKFYNYDDQEQGNLSERLYYIGNQQNKFIGFG